MCHDLGVVFMGFRPIQRALGKHGWFLSDSNLFSANFKSPSEMLGRYGGWDQE